MMPPKDISLRLQMMNAIGATDNLMTEEREMTRIETNIEPPIPPTQTTLFDQMRSNFNFPKNTRLIAIRFKSASGKAVFRVTPAGWELFGSNGEHFRFDESSGVAVRVIGHQDVPVTAQDRLDERLAHVGTETAAGRVSVTKG